MFLTLSMAPSLRGVRKIQVDCVTKDEGIRCTDVEIPQDGKGKECIVPAEYTYTITNNGADVERLYSVTVTRGANTYIVTDIPPEIPTVDLGPGEVLVTPVTREIDVCTEIGIDAFDTKAILLTGPPTSVDVSTTASTKPIGAYSSLLMLVDCCMV